MKKFLFYSLLLSQLSLMAQERIPCNQAFKKLMEGNKRFMQDLSLHPDRTSERRQELTSNQTPFACILGCADSRVSPEIIFDQGIGDLFIVRVAGNVVGPIEMESIEYSVHYLHACMILVLGHENCGAVNAVLAGQTQDIETIAKYVEPSLKATPCGGEGRLECAVKANARATAERIKKDPSFVQMIKENKLQVMAGYYNFHTGKVEILN